MEELGYRWSKEYNRFKKELGIFHDGEYDSGMIGQDQAVVDYQRTTSVRLYDAIIKLCDILRDIVAGNNSGEHNWTQDLLKASEKLISDIDAHYEDKIRTLNSKLEKEDRVAKVKKEKWMDAYKSYNGKLRSRSTTSRDLDIARRMLCEICDSLRIRDEVKATEQGLSEELKSALKALDVAENAYRNKFQDLDVSLEQELQKILQESITTYLVSIHPPIRCVGDPALQAKPQKISLHTHHEAEAVKPGQLRRQTTRAEDTLNETQETTSTVYAPDKQKTTSNVYAPDKTAEGNMLIYKLDPEALARNRKYVVRIFPKQGDDKLTGFERLTCGSKASECQLSGDMFQINESIARGNSRVIDFRAVSIPDVSTAGARRLLSSSSSSFMNRSLSLSQSFTRSLSRTPSNLDGDIDGEHSSDDEQGNNQLIFKVQCPEVRFLFVFDVPFDVMLALLRFLKN